jgi:peptidyl-prolyl cis-trans isomerase C
MTPRLPRRLPLAALILLALLLAGCVPVPGTASVPTLTVAPIPTPTATPLPMAVIVNGEGINQAEFDSELRRYQQAQAGLGETVSVETASSVVLENFVDLLLMEQAAAAYGFTPDDDSLQSRIETLALDAGGPEALAAWITAHGYTPEEFAAALRRQVAAAWMRDRVTASVTATAEQVHVKQILLYNEEEAQQALGYLQAGWNFEDLAAQYDPVTKGELGWFPRGYLPSLAIEEAVFALQPGQYSAILQDEGGYHILYVMERDPARQLSPDALLTLREQALQTWLNQRRNESTIIYPP